MSAVNLPTVLESTLASLSDKYKLSSWDVRGRGKQATVIIRFETDEAILQAVNNTGYRRKSPSELRRDQQRAIAARERQQLQHVTLPDTRVTTNTTQGTVGLLAVSTSDTSDPVDTVDTFDVSGLYPPDRPEPSPLSTVRDDVPRRDDSDTSITSDTDRRFVDVDVVATDSGVDGACASVSIGDGEVERIVSEWEERDVLKRLSELGKDECEKVVASVRSNGPVFCQVVNDHRGNSNSLVACTNDFIFIYDLETDRLVHYTELTEKTKQSWYVRDYLDVLERWPRCDSLEFATQLERLKIHACACYSIIMKHADDDHDHL